MSGGAAELSERLFGDAGPELVAQGGDAAFGGNIARYINHACRPNCYVDIVGRTIWIRASRRIRTGEELTYDYNTDGAAKIPCRCRKGCRKII